MTQTHRYNDGRRRHFFGAVFLATLVEQVDDHDDEVLEVRLFEKHALPSRVFGPDAPVLRDFVAGRRTPVIG